MYVVIYNLVINSLQPVPLLHFFEINVIVLKMMQSDYMANSQILYCFDVGRKV